MEEIDPDNLEQTLQTLSCHQRDNENNYQTPHSQQMADWVTKYCTTFHEKTPSIFFFQELNDTKHHDNITITQWEFLNYFVSNMKNKI